MTTAVIVGAGPNGLTAAAVLARAGVSVTVFEARDRVGGAASSDTAFEGEATVDLGAAAHPFGITSPAFRSLELDRHGLEWVHAPEPMAHPLPGGRAAILHHDLDQTARQFGVDARAWRLLHEPIADRPHDTAASVLGPLLRIPQNPLLFARLGIRGALPASVLARTLFRSGAAQAMFAANATHATLPLHHPLTSAFGVTFGGFGSSTGWPFARGGTQAISDALAAAAAEAGARIETGTEIRSLDELPAADATLLDITPRQLLTLAGDRLPWLYERRMRGWKYGPAGSKVDLLLDGPIPWADSRVEGAGTVHVGGTLAEIEHAEREVARGRMPQRPFVLVTQPTAADSGRAAEGRHLVWAYAHVPFGWEGDAVPLIEAQIERFAPGFRDRIVGRRATPPAMLEQWNPNLVGGSIGGGSIGGTQQLARPRLLKPYRVPIEEPVYLCSSSTPPGGGVHGMSGWHAAQAVLRDLTA